MTQEQWHAIKNRDKNYDGTFFYALRTGQTFCHPSCNAKSCNPENVIVFHSLEDAISQGLRPCSRCRPNQMGWKGAKAELTDAAKQRIESHYMDEFSLDAIANDLFVNRHYLNRVFKEITGNTMLSYHNYIRCQIAKSMLEKPNPRIAFVGRQVGYISASHFTRVFKSIFHCTPSAYRRRCRNCSES